MIRTRTFGVVLVAVVLSALVVHGQRSAHYRDFQLGTNVASVLALSGAHASDVTTVHNRPIIQQELEWHRPYTIGGATDSVQQIAFSFFDDQLFRLVIDYDREKTDGMTDADMIDAISMMYGATIRPAARATSAPIDRLDQASGMRVATWGDAEFVAALYRSSYASGFRLIVTSTQLNARARSAEAEAVRLDVRDAPERERARLKKEADDTRAVQEKARLANKATFVP
jgi:hypothetical protein